MSLPSSPVFLLTGLLRFRGVETPQLTRLSSGCVLVQRTQLWTVCVFSFTVLQAEQPFCWEMRESVLKFYGSVGPQDVWVWVGDCRLLYSGFPVMFRGHNSESSVFLFLQVLIVSSCNHCVSSLPSCLLQCL